jgi:pre-mRNA-splicing factor CWC26
MSSGVTAGLKDAASFKAELQEAMARREAAAAAPAELGAGAATVYRDKRGRKLDMLNEYMASQERADSRAAAQHELRYDWGTGAADKARAETKAGELRDAAERPFAVFADDAKLNEELKQRQRADDPMAAYMAGKAAPAQPEPAGGRRSKPLYSGPPPERNRFGIAPGYRWDGIDRSNGAEKRLAQASGATGELAEKHYRFSSADM